MKELKLFVKLFGEMLSKCYLCNVFFIVLDLRLTIRLAAASHFFCLKSNYQKRCGLSVLVADEPVVDEVVEQQ